MRRALAMTVAVGALALAPAAQGGQPEDPGCFGQDRAFFIVEGHVPGPGPGASTWGQEASERKGDNGELNRGYKSACGGDPS